MTELVRNQRQNLVERAQTFASMSEDDLKRFAAEACRDRKVAALWELTEAHLTLHGSSGARVSSHTLSTYRYGALELLRDWQDENLLRPSRNAGVLWVRELEARHAAVGTVRSRLSGAKALYAALRWSGATSAAPFTDVRPACIRPYSRLGEAAGLRALGGHPSRDLRRRV